jgi:hypothetical protein
LSIFAPFEVVAMTRQPSIFANWIAKSDTPPLPRVRTVWPGPAIAPLVTEFHAVRPAHGNVAASSQVRCCGTATAHCSSSTAYSVSMPSSAAELVAHVGSQSPVDPSWPVAADDPIAGLESTDLLADRDDFACAVADRDDPRNRRQRVLLVEDERIAPVERDGTNSDDDLGGLRRRLVGLAQHDPVDTSRAFQVKRAHSRQGVLV